MTGAENFRTWSHVIENPHEPNPSSIFDTITADLPSPTTWKTLLRLALACEADGSDTKEIERLLFHSCKRRKWRQIPLRTGRIFLEWQRKWCRNTGRPTKPVTKSWEMRNNRGKQWTACPRLLTPCLTAHDKIRLLKHLFTRRQTGFRTNLALPLRWNVASNCKMEI